MANAAATSMSLGIDRPAWAVEQDERVVDGLVRADGQHDGEAGGDARPERVGQRARLVAARAGGRAAQLDQLVQRRDRADRDAGMFDSRLRVGRDDLRDALARLDRDEQRGLDAKQLTRLAHERAPDGVRLGTGDRRGHEARNSVDGVDLRLGHGRWGTLRGLTPGSAVWHRRFTLAGSRRGGRVAEGTRLLSEYGDQTPSRVRIPPSPLQRPVRVPQ